MRGWQASLIILGTLVVGAGIGIAIGKPPINPFALTAHQLDVIRTLFAAIGATGGFFGGMAAIFSYLGRKYAKQAAENTTTMQRTRDGGVRPITVAAVALHTLQQTGEIKGEVTDMATEQRVHGRRRMMTDSIPKQPRPRVPASQSIYRSMEDE